MTDDQREKLMGVVFGFACVVALPSFVLFLIVADNWQQAAVYSGFVFLVAFAVIRWWFMRKVKKFRL